MKTETGDTHQINPEKAIMMMMIKKFASIIFLSALALTAFPQDKDFGIWYGAALRYEILSKLDLDISSCLRTYENARKMEQAYIEAGLEYKINNYLSAEGSYRLTTNYENDLKYHLQHKLFADLKGNIKAGQFTFSGRVRFQSRFKTYFEEVDDKIPDHTVRIRFKTTYRTPSFRANPYAYVETFLPVFADKERIVGKNRFCGGIEYSFSKKHSIELEYIFQRDFLPDIKDENIISLNYNLKF